MIRTLLSLAMRRFFNNLSYSSIMLSGLVVGITSAILVFVWVTYEIQYDRYHPDNDKVFAVMINELVEGNIETSEETPAPLADYFDSTIPEVEAFTRIDNSRLLISYATKSIQKFGLYADTGYFQVFHPELIAGNRVHPLPDNKSVVISSKLAQLLFENKDVLGKVITINKQYDFKVTGVFAEYPENSSLNKYEYILPYHAKPRQEGEWQNYYVRLNDAESREAVEAKINGRLKEFFGNDNSKSLLFCLTDWRLHWNFENGKVSGGRIVYVIIFSITALFILGMAGVNYVNIMTAGAAKRAREIGVRKITGATHRELVRQFLSESLLITFIASFISLGVAYFLLPLFNELIGVDLIISLSDPVLLIGLFFIALLTGLSAGMYPAFLLSSLKPAIVLKGNTFHGLTGAGLRRALVVFQFTLSIILIFSALVVWQQTNYLLKKDLGYEKNNVINIWLPSQDRLPLQSFKAEIQNHTSVVSVGVAGASPMEINGYDEVHWSGMHDNKPLLFFGVSADPDLLPTLGFKFVQGRNFSREFQSDSSGFILNQKAADLLGFEDPIGQTITYNMFGKQEGKIIGVIKDFQNDDIHVSMAPVIFTFGKEQDLHNLFVRYEEGQLEEALSHCKNVFNKFQPDIPLSYSFLDSDFENQFYQEKLLGNFSVWSTTIAFIIAGLGLFGLTIFNTQRRTKEIGVRKVLGATVTQILIMLCRDFLKPVLISFLIAFPIAYYLMEQFLADYAFRITIPVLTFILVGAAMTALVLITVSYQSFHAAVKNPVESLKTE